MATPTKSRIRTVPPPRARDPEEVLGEFSRLQQQLVDRWQAFHDVDLRARDVVVVPSLSLDGFQLGAIDGIDHYEERMLFTFGLLRNPRARLVYVTSQALDPVVVDYFLALLGGHAMASARERLTLLCCNDATPRPLSQKILERPRLVQRIRDSIQRDRAHMTVFTVSDRERLLAVELGIPLYGVDPRLLSLGTKSGSRKLFREAGVPMPPGVEDVRDARGVAEGVANLWAQEPWLRRVVVKLDQGFSGEGNALLDLEPLRHRGLAAAAATERVRAIEGALSGLAFASPRESPERFLEALGEMGGVVEAWVEGEAKQSPSVQLRINPRGHVEAMSTHDQVLGGPTGQVYLGCRFPADPAYALEIQRDALAVGALLRDRGCVGRVGVDFLVARAPGGALLRYAIEINLRMTGTTHPMMTMKLLGNGEYDPERGLYLTHRGEPRYYVSSDNVQSPAYRGLLPSDVLDVAALHDVHYRPWTETGSVFHLLGAVSQFGKLGMTSIGRSPEEAEELRLDTLRALDEEARVISGA